MHVGEEDDEFGGWDRGFTKRLIDTARPIGKRWFRWDVRGLETFPTHQGALVVSNHSGGS